MTPEVKTAITDDDLKLHRMWLRGEDGGKRLVAIDADLSGADLSGANLSGANLSGADLSGANLSGANLSRADLSGANLSRADLSGANLSGANLSRANLSGANLSRADLSRAYLSRADLSGANLSGANLSRANLSGADLSRANLSRAYLSGANLSRAYLSRANLSRADLSGANLSGAYLDHAEIIHKHSIVPEAGRFTAFKKVRCDETHSPVILMLEVPATALRLGGLVGRKCRVSKARVVKAETPDGEPFTGAMRSGHDAAFKYEVGALVEVADFCTDPKVECAPGIHVWLTRREACEW